MREILFRGKTNSGIWIYWNEFGDLTDENGKLCPHVRSSRMTIDYLESINDYSRDIISETIGQFTGLTDKNGKRIFEGDVVKTKYDRLCIVVWRSSPAHNGWDLDVVPTVENCLHTKCPDEYDLYHEDNLEVIGNVHDNPELLSDEKKPATRKCSECFHCERSYHLDPPSGMRYVRRRCGIHPYALVDVYTEACEDFQEGSRHD